MNSVKDASHYSMTSHGDEELLPMVILVKSAAVTIMQHHATTIKMSISLLIAMRWVVVECATALTTQLDKTVKLAYNSFIDLLVVIDLHQMLAFLVTVM